MLIVLPTKNIIDMDIEIIKAIKELSDPHPLQMFVEDELSFYKKHFNHFTSNVIREKKILVFENPNRMCVTYEFDVQQLQKTENLLFVFLPNTRKNWLKIMWEGGRLSVCNAKDVKKAIYEIVKDDLSEVKQKINNADENSLWDQIWNERERLPCFVRGTQLEGDGQLVVNYYDSFGNYKHKGHLFDERCYCYEYVFDAGESHWIYVKSPERFQITINTDDERASVIKGNDPEIKAYRIFHSTKTESIKFNITIRVPETLKLWYSMIVFLSIGLIITFPILGIGLIRREVPLSPAFAQVGISLVAAIIATRGWIMNDETVLKRVSITMTILAIIILILLIVMYSIVGFNNK